jgi:hypothetical protein
VRADECSVDRGKIDYARILLSTTSLEVLNRTVALQIDGQKYSIKLVEEWGCNLGEDVFLTEGVLDQQEQNVDDIPEHGVGHGLEELDREVDTLIEDIHREWRDHEANVPIVVVKHDGSQGGIDIKHGAARDVACTDMTCYFVRVST